MLAQSGAELYGLASLGDSGALVYRLYAGTISLNNQDQLSNPRFELLSIDAPYVAGGRSMYETPIEGLRAGGSVQALRLDLDLIVGEEVLEPLRMSGAVPADYDGRLLSQIEAILWVLSAEYALDRLLLAAEYGRWHVHNSSDQAAVAPERRQVREHFYVMGSYQLGSWIHPGVYYSLFFPNRADRSGPDASQHDLAVTLRFDLNSFWPVKVEGHFLYGTAMLNARQNDGVLPADLDRTWGLFLANTTLHF